MCFSTRFKMKMKSITTQKTVQTIVINTLKKNKVNGGRNLNLKMTQETFQEHVLKELSAIKDLFITNAIEHGELSSKVESVRTELHKLINTNLWWSIGAVISIAGLVFLIVKYVS